MTTKDEVIAALAAGEARLAGLAPRLLAQAATPLVESEWNVRQALCHVAARANAVPLATRLAERALAAKAQGQPLDLRGGPARPVDVNQAQLDERQDRSVADLLSEIYAGHQAAIAAVQAMTAETFDQRFPRIVGEGEQTLGELILLAGWGHENNHLDHIERSIEQALA